MNESERKDSEKVGISICIEQDKSQGIASSKVVETSIAPNDSDNLFDNLKHDPTQKNDTERCGNYANANISNSNEINKNENCRTKKTNKRKMKSRSQRKRDRRLRSLNDNHNQIKPKHEVSSIPQTKIQTKIVRLRLPSKIVNNNDDLTKEGYIPNAPCIRIVHPYPYTFTSNVKGRWVGRTVFDVYSTEFGSYPSSYYEMAIEQGRIKVSNRVVSNNYILQNNDVLSHTIHRHEPAVAVSNILPQSYEYQTGWNNTTIESDNVITIVADTDQVLVVDKPSTVPVHPCGGYHQNTLMTILESIRESRDKDSVNYEAKNVVDDDMKPIQESKYELRYEKLFTIHRLDRLTSGLVVLAKTSEVAKEWGKAIQERGDCEKLYLARVQGKFGSDSSFFNHVPRIGLNSLSNNENVDVKIERIPNHGEWYDKQYADQKQNASSNKKTNVQKVKNFKNNMNGFQEIERNDMEDAKYARNRNALGYWITNERDILQNKVTLSDYSALQHSVDEWFDVLERHTSEKKEYAKSTKKTDGQISKPLYWLHLACPVRIENHKSGICSAGCFSDIDDTTYVKTVKPAQTSFAIIKYNEEDDTTILLVRPVTGRTHQIRIHLQFINYCIANDPNYGGKLWFGNPIGEQACSLAQRLLGRTGLEDKSDEEDWYNCVGTTNLDASRIITDEPATNREIESIAKEQVQENESIDSFIRRTCVWCARMKSINEEDRAHLEFLVRSPGLWLHALQYTVKGVSFRNAAT